MRICRRVVALGNQWLSVHSVIDPANQIEQEIMPPSLASEMEEVSLEYCHYLMRQSTMVRSTPYPTNYPTNYRTNYPTNYPIGHGVVTFSNRSVTPSNCLLLWQAAVKTFAQNEETDEQQKNPLTEWEDCERLLDR